MSIYVKNGMNGMDGMDDRSSATQYVEKLYNHTQEGKLQLYGWHYDNPGWGCGRNTDEGYLYECAVNWNEQDCAAMAQCAHALVEDLRRIAAHRADLDGACFDECNEVSRERALSVLGDEHLVDVYFTYVYSYTLEGIDMDRVLDIYNRWDDCIHADVFGDEAEPVSEEDKTYYRTYLGAVRAAAEQRIGESICASEVIFFARRLCRLLEIGAPEIIVNNELHCFVEALVLHHHGVRKEIVGSIPEEDPANESV